MPAALTLAEDYKDEVTVIFVESQGLSLDEADAFAFGKNWMGTHAMWTTERPFDTGARGLPNFALLSNQGEVLLKGHPLSMKKRIEEDIAYIGEPKPARGDGGMPPGMDCLYGIEGMY